MKFEIRLYSEFDFYNLIVQAFSKHFFDKYCLYFKTILKKWNMIHRKKLLIGLYIKNIAVFL